MISTTHPPSFSFWPLKSVLCLHRVTLLDPCPVLDLTSLLRVNALGASAAPPPLDPFFALPEAKVRWHATLTASLVVRIYLRNLAWFTATTFFWERNYIEKLSMNSSYLTACIQHHDCLEFRYLLYKEDAESVQRVIWTSTSRIKFLLKSLIK